MQMSLSKLNDQIAQYSNNVCAYSVKLRLFSYNYAHSALLLHFLLTMFLKFILFALYEDKERIKIVFFFHVLQTLLENEICALVY